MIYIYAMDTMKLEPELEAYQHMIPESRLYQLKTLPGQQRQLSLAAELLFQRAVHRHCREVPTPVSRDKDENGKPYLLGRPDFYFNLSHSGMWAVCAVADHPVGVDIQQHRPISTKIARKFSPAEQQRIDSAVGDDKSELMFDLWVQKEAFLKCTGEGLRRSTKTFEAEHPAPGYCNQLVDFPVSDYHLAVCTRQEEREEPNLIIMPF
jgi:4'-phosphopantetheinyl transferase